MSAPSSRWIAALIALSIIVATSYGLWMRDKTIRTEQMKANYDLGYYKAQNEMLEAAMAEGRRAINTFSDTSREVVYLPDDGLARRAADLGIMCHGSDC